MVDIEVTKPNASEQIKMVAYGQPGTGKTHLCGTAQDVEEARDVLFVSAESGETTIRDKAVDMVAVSNFDQIEHIREFLYKHTQFRDDEEQRAKVNEHFGFPEDAEYNTVALDSITEIDKISMMDVQGIDYSTHGGDIEPPEGNDWQKHISQMRHFLRSYRDLDMNVIITALQSRDKDESDGTVSIQPDLPGSLAGQICGFMDIVGYTYKREVDDSIKYFMKTETDSKFSTKDRFGTIESPMRNPSFEKLYDQIFQ